MHLTVSGLCPCEMHQTSQSIVFSTMAARLDLDHLDDFPALLHVTGHNAMALEVLNLHSKYYFL